VTGSAAFAGRRALVTGAGSGMGRAIAEALAGRGAAVACVDINQDTAEATAALVRNQGARAVAARADVSRSADVAAAFEAAATLGGPPDTVVCCAGVIDRQPYLEVTEDQWDLTLATNLKGLFLAGQAAARGMIGIGGGVIVNITSIGAFRVKPNRAPYQASKYGAQGLTETMALELAPHRIRVNAVAPGPTKTGMTTDLQGTATPAASAVGIAPLGRWGLPADMAAAVCFLASDDAGFITGATLVVDGGYSLVLG
jgi:NAD(P)-dependent dehydrogenase (short-subunit alcohol dehydrogenase family)